MAGNRTLDCNCNGHAIIGPVTSGTRANEFYGIYAEKKSNIHIKNCNVYHFDRGVYFLNVKNATIKDSNFYENVRYGANLAGKQSFNNQWDGNTFHDNGDEGIHISGQPTGFLRGTTKPNKFTNSSAYNNDLEGWYLLGSNYVQIYGGSAYDNGQAGIYLKHSHHNRIYNMTVTHDTVHIIGDSDYNEIHDVTVVGGQVRLEKYFDQPTQVTTYPNYNDLNQVCVQHENGTPSVGFNFVGVTNGYNDVTNSETVLASTSADPIKAVDTTTHNSVVDLYISPSGMTNDIQTGSSFDTLTMQTTTPPTCYAP